MGGQGARLDRRVEPDRGGGGGGQEDASCAPGASLARSTREMPLRRAGCSPIEAGLPALGQAEKPLDSSQKKRLAGPLLWWTST
jgi:hypothetical protein